MEYVPKTALDTTLRVEQGISPICQRHVCAQVTCLLRRFGRHFSWLLAPVLA
jgi:hypothetical protein